MRSLALAATILLLASPESLIEPGFQMSFAAVASLIAVAEWEQRRVRAPTPPLPFTGARRYMRGIAITSFVGSVATMPYAAFHFDRATHYAVLGNLLAMPIMGFVTMPAAAISVMLMPLGLDAVPLHIMGWGIDAMLAVGRFVSRLPGAVSIVAAWPMAALVLDFTRRAVDRDLAQPLALARSRAGSGGNRAHRAGPAARSPCRARRADNRCARR